MSEFTLHLGDCIEVMRGMADNSVLKYILVEQDEGYSALFLSQCARAAHGRTNTGKPGYPHDLLPVQKKNFDMVVCDGHECFGL